MSDNERLSEINVIDTNLMKQLKHIKRIYKNKPAKIDDIDFDNYKYLQKFILVSTAIETMLKTMLLKKYKEDLFINQFMSNKLKHSGSFLDADDVEKISTLDLNTVKTIDFKKKFLNATEKNIFQSLDRSGEIFIFEKESFSSIYKAIKKQRNIFSHSGLFNIDEGNDFSDKMFIKFLKIYYAVYLIAKKILI